MKNPSVKAPSAEASGIVQTTEKTILPVSIRHESHDEVSAEANISKMMINAKYAMIGPTVHKQSTVVYQNISRIVIQGGLSQLPQSLQPQEAC